MAITAQELIDRARQRADFQNSGYLNDTTELLPWCRESYKELWDLMIEAYGEDYVIASTTLDVPPDDWPKLDALDPPFYKPRLLHRIVNGIAVPLQKFNLEDWVFDYNNYSWGERQDVAYHLAGREIYFQPRPNVTEEVVLLYVPQAELANLTDEINFAAEPWAEYIVVDLAIKMRKKEQSDASDFMLEKDKLERRIVSAATPRDAARPQRTVDTRSLDEVPWEWWGDW